MTTYHFCFRPSIRQHQKGSISLRITHHRRSKSIALPIKIFSHQWNDKLRTTTSQQLNKKLSDFQLHVQQIVHNLAQQGNYTADDVALRFRCHINGSTLLDFTQIIANLYKKRKQERTARAYLSATSRLITFCKDKVLYLKDITGSLMQDFEKHLLDEGLTRNTTSFYMRNLRAIYNKAVQMKEILAQEESPFAQVFTGMERTRKRALTKDEINTLYNTNVRGNEKLKLARKLFFFGFHACGMSFVDMAYLKKSDVKRGIIRYRRRKTGRIVEVKITKSLQKLINYFLAQKTDSPYLLPIIKDKSKDTRLQYESALRLQNSRLKLLAKISNFVKPISTHVCRHSWASLAKMLNTPLAVISESLGHSDEKTTAIYLASFDRKILDKVSEKVSRLIKQTKLSQVTLSTYI